MVVGWSINILLTSMMVINLIPIFIENWCYLIVYIKKLFNIFHHKFRRIKIEYCPSIYFKFLEWCFKKKEIEIDPEVH